MQRTGRDRVGGACVGAVECCIWPQCYCHCAVVSLHGLGDDIVCLRRDHSSSNASERLRLCV